MTTLVFGVGVGLFIILSLWVLAALIFVISLRVERKVGVIAVLLVSAITIILISVPRASEKPAPRDGKVYDRLFIWRILLLILLLVSSVISLVGYIEFELVEANRPNYKRYEINNNSEFVNKVMNGTVPVIVNFHADWCDPCKILTPRLIELIEPMDKLDLAIVDVEENPELVHAFEVKAVPAVIAISNGLVVDKFIGLVNNEMIENLIQKLTHEGPIITESTDTKS